MCAMKNHYFGTHRGTMGLEDCFHGTGNNFPRVSLMYRDGIGRLQLWNCSCALHTVLIPSSCGMFVYKLVASKDTKIVSGGTLALFIKLIIGWSRLST